MPEELWDATRLDILIERVRGGEPCSKLGPAAYDILRVIRLGLQMGNAQGISNFGDTKAVDIYSFSDDLLKAAHKEEFYPMESSMRRALHELRIMRAMGLEFFAVGLETDMGRVSKAGVVPPEKAFGRRRLTHN